MEDIKKMIALNNKYRKKAINISTSKIEVKRKLAVVEESEIPEDEEAMKEREEQIEKLKEKYADLVRQEERAKERRSAKDLRTAKINERNQLGNILRMDNAKSQVQQQAEAGAINPFMRRATRPKILWDMAGGNEEKKKKEEEVKEDKPQKEDKEKEEKEEGENFNSI